MESRRRNFLRALKDPKIGLTYRIVGLAILVGTAQLSGCQLAEPLKPTQVSTNTAVPTHTSFPTHTPIPIPTEVPTEIPTALPAGVELVNLKTPDDIDLVGYLHRPETPLNDKLAVVLAHGHTSSHAEWASFEKILVENGVTTVTFDFRGHGSSSGTDRFSTIGIDVQTVFNYLDQNGYQRVICIGASMGGAACLAGAIKVDIDGLVMLSSE